MRSLKVALVAIAAVLLTAAPAGAAPAPTDPHILGGWTESGGENGPLGAPVGGVVTFFDGGVGQEFEGGGVLWSASTGSHAVHGLIWEVMSWGGFFGPGLLGYPTAGPVCGLRDGGCSQEFQQGAWYSLPGTGAYRVYSGDRTVWARSGKENGPLGYPVADKFCGGLPGNGCLQHFQGGAIYDAPAPGADAAVMGPISRVWLMKPVMDILGQPTADQVCGRPGGGCTQAFTNGAMYWSAATGATYSRGAILTAYKRTGAEAGPLGYPTTGEVCGLAKGGCLQLFRNGGIYWSPSTGAHPVRGTIGTTWNNNWSQSGRLGYPTTDERCGLRAGGCFQEFQGGAIYWSPASGAHAVSGGLRDAWARQGWERGRLGYPVSAATLSGGAFRQTFQGGSIAISSRGTSITYR